jgi:hypothetical protein
MRFSNGTSHEEVLHSSETHRIPFQNDQIDFFLVPIDHSEVTLNELKVRFASPSADATKNVHWHCAWIEIRDTFYQRNYWYETIYGG